MSDHKDETKTKDNLHSKIIPQITTVTNITAKFPYLKKGEYDIWAMKMQNFISSSDLLCWNIVLKGHDKYIGEGELGIDDSNVSIFHTTSDGLEGQPIYN
nr:hypothetical protein [Tanacetum cinerariifolium]